MVTGNSLLDRVQAIVARVAGPARMPAHVTADTPLGEDGYWLDSIAILEVLVACEEEFGLIFDWQHELTRDALSTVRRLAGLIETKTP